MVKFFQTTKEYIRNLTKRLNQNSGDDDEDEEYDNYSTSEVIVSKGILKDKARIPIIKKDSLNFLYNLDGTPSNSSSTLDECIVEVDIVAKHCRGCNHHRKDGKTGPLEYLGKVVYPYEAILRERTENPTKKARPSSFDHPNATKRNFQEECEKILENLQGIKTSLDSNNSNNINTNTTTPQNLSPYFQHIQEYSCKKSSNRQITTYLTPSETDLYRI